MSFFDKNPNLFKNIRPQWLEINCHLFTIEGEDHELYEEFYTQLLTSINNNNITSEHLIELILNIANNLHVPPLFININDLVPKIISEYKKFLSRETEDRELLLEIYTGNFPDRHDQYFFEVDFVKDYRKKIKLTYKELKYAADLILEFMKDNNIKKILK